jgi:hypothetical protein
VLGGSLSRLGVFGWFRRVCVRTEFGWVRTEFVWDETEFGFNRTEFGLDMTEVCLG